MDQSSKNASDRDGDRAGNRHASVGQPPSPATQGYELRYFARKHGLTTAQAMDLIRRIGNDRAQLNEAAVRLKRSVGNRRPAPGG